MPLRGHSRHDSVLWQLKLEWAKSHERLSRRDNWMSDTIQSKTLEMFAHAIQREIISETQHSFLGLTADGATDISACEQFSCCLLFVDSHMTAPNMFLGFYNVGDSLAETRWFIAYTFHFVQGPKLCSSYAQLNGASTPLPFHKSLLTTRLFSRL